MNENILNEQLKAEEKEIFRGQNGAGAHEVFFYNFLEIWESMEGGLVGKSQIRER